MAACHRKGTDNLFLCWRTQTHPTRVPVPLFDHNLHGSWPWVYNLIIKQQHQKTLISLPALCWSLACFKDQQGLCSTKDIIRVFLPSVRYTPILLRNHSSSLYLARREGNQKCGGWMSLTSKHQEGRIWMHWYGASVRRSAFGCWPTPCWHPLLLVLLGV